MFFRFVEAFALRGLDMFRLVVLRFFFLNRGGLQATQNARLARRHQERASMDNASFGFSLASHSQVWDLGNHCAEVYVCL